MRNFRIARIAAGRASAATPAATSLSRSFLSLALACSLIPLFAAGGCRKGEKHYSLQGEVISADPARGILVIKEDKIPGYMAAMTMSYIVADPRELRGLQPGDIVKGELVVSQENTKVTHIALVKKAKPAGPPASTPPPSKNE
jgi:Cu/Ag efflux protein CusF